jgi:hypothetical protein
MITTAKFEYCRGVPLTTWRLDNLHSDVVPYYQYMGNKGPDLNPPQIVIDTHYDWQMNDDNAHQYQSYQGFTLESRQGIG